MVPCCNYCDRQCFVHLPSETPQYILGAFGAANLMATCQTGQEHDKERTGFCYKDVIALIANAWGLNTVLAALMSADEDYVSRMKEYIKRPVLAYDQYGQLGTATFAVCDGDVIITTFENTESIDQRKAV